MGRGIDTKRLVVKKELVLDLLRRGLSHNLATDAVGCSRSWLWRARMKDKAFDDAVRAVYLSPNQPTPIVPDPLWAKAMDGDVAAICTFLVNRTRRKPEQDRYHHLHSIVARDRRTVYVSAEIIVEADSWLDDGLLPLHDLDEHEIDTEGWGNVENVA